MSVLDRNVVDFGHEDDDKVTVFLKGVSLTPAFIIEPTDEEYENSENLFGFDEAEFYEKIKFTSFEDRISVIDVLK